ncbi:YfhO family protein [Paraburkholderia aromaticivorans]|uniref:YfhO family protein n=1 Tax=Paraburkholderia aromaticivorans TaxID=2026199 RepID=UPI0038B7341B
MPDMKDTGHPAKHVTITAIILLCLAPLVVKAPLLVGLLISDPTLLYAGLQQGLQHGPFGGFPPFATIDPNIAFTSHALGHRAVLDILNGQWPWWNHYEGVGAPLAGEMQSAALFPLTLLLYFKDGQLYMHLALQIIAGVSTYVLLRRMGIAQAGSLAAALAFQFNGTFAWLANAVINPIAFLPLTLVGVEIALERVADGRRGGAFWVTIGLVAALYAGFPEMAYLDGLLILCWTLVRMGTLPSVLRVRFLLRVCFSGVVALLLSAPVLIAFFDYLPLSFTGGHEGNGFAAAHLPASVLIATLVPYIFGGIFQDPNAGGFWGSVGGYAGIVLVMLALCGIVGQRYRGLRIMLTLWIVVTVSLSYGLPGTSALVWIIPGLKLAAFYRYLPPSWEFSLCVLAALALNDAASGSLQRRLGYAYGTVLVLLVAGCAIALSAGVRPHGRYVLGAVIFTGLLLAALALVLFIGLRNADSKRLALALSIFLAGESTVYFIAPVMSNPSHGTVDLAGVKFLQANLGMQRFVTLGPVQPNYGSYFGIASINHNDLPIPRIWTDFVTRKLDANAPPILFTGSSRADAGGPSSQDSLLKNLPNYLAIGTRYVLVPTGVPLPEGAKAKGIKEVAADTNMRIYELGNPRPYFDAPTCWLEAATRGELRANCPLRATLTRLELYMPGWHAFINGQEATINQVNEIFQQIDLPAGSSRVQFVFRPPHIEWAFVAFAIGLLMMLGELAVSVRSKRSAMRA